jgi:hypothetical protein
MMNNRNGSPNSNKDEHKGKSLSNIPLTKLNKRINLLPPCCLRAYAQMFLKVLAYANSGCKAKKHTKVNLRPNSYKTK